jgi:hypothetical protein
MGEGGGKAVSFSGKGSHIWCQREDDDKVAALVGIELR